MPTSGKPPTPGVPENTESKKSWSALLGNGVGHNLPASGPRLVNHASAVHFGFGITQTCNLRRQSDPRRVRPLTPSQLASQRPDTVKKHRHPAITKPINLAIANLVARREPSPPMLERWSGHTTDFRMEVPARPDVLEVLADRNPATTKKTAKCFCAKAWHRYPRPPANVRHHTPLKKRPRVSSDAHCLFDNRASNQIKSARNGHFVLIGGLGFCPPPKRAPRNRPGHRSEPPFIEHLLRPPGDVFTNWRSWSHGNFARSRSAGDGRIGTQPDVQR